MTTLMSTQLVHCMDVGHAQEGSASSCLREYSGMLTSAKQHATERRHLSQSGRLASGSA